MTNDGMTVEAHKQIVKPLSQTYDHIWRASVRSEKKSACVRAVRLSVHPVAFMAVATVWTRNCQKEEKLRSAQDYKWSPDSDELDNN